MDKPQLRNMFIITILIIIILFSIVLFIFNSIEGMTNIPYSSRYSFIEYLTN